MLFILFFFTPLFFAFRAHEHQSHYFTCDMVESNNFFVSAIHIFALFDGSLLKSWIIDDIWVDNKLCKFGFEISLVNAVFELITLLSSF